MLARPLLIVASAVLVACQLEPVPSAKSGGTPVHRAEARDVSEYGRVTSSEELRALVDRDLAQGEFATADRGLEELMARCTLDHHATLAHLWMQELEPVWRFQLKGATHYIARIQARLSILANAAAKELDQAHAAIERNDMDRLRRLRADPRSVLGAEVLAASSDHVPHAAFVDGLFLFDDLRSSTSPDAQSARAVAAAMEACAPALERQGHGEASFGARLVAAEALDLAGLETEAIEKWLALGRSRYLAEAPESVQVAIAGRIHSYSEQLRAALTARIRSEEQDIARAQIQDVERRYGELSAEQRARIAALESEVQRIGTQKDAEARASLGIQRAGFEDTLESQKQRIRELEALFLEIATAKDTNWRSESDQFLERTGGAVSFAADVFTIWQAACLISSKG